MKAHLREKLPEMNMVEKFKTPHEELGAGKFGTDYIGRNNSAHFLASSLNFFSKALKQAGRVTPCIEFGANISSVRLRQKWSFIQS